MYAENLANARHPDSGAFRSGSSAQNAFLPAIGRTETVRHQRLHDRRAGRARNGPIATERPAENGRRNQQPQRHFASSSGSDLEATGHDRVGMIPPDSDTMLTAAISTTTTLIYIIISSSIMKATELSSSLIRLLKKITRGIAADCCTGIIILRRERETERARLFFY